MLRLTHEGVANFATLSDFDKKNMTRVFKNSIPAIEADSINSIASEASIAGSSIPSVLVIRLITAVNAAKHHRSITRVMNPQNIACTSVLGTFKSEYEVFLSVRDKDE